MRAPLLLEIATVTDAYFSVTSAVSTVCYRKKRNAREPETEREAERKGEGRGGKREIPRRRSSCLCTFFAHSAQPMLEIAVGYATWHIQSFHSYRKQRGEILRVVLVFTRDTLIPPSFPFSPLFSALSPPSLSLPFRSYGDTLIHTETTTAADRKREGEGERKRLRETKRTCLRDQRKCVCVSAFFHPLPPFIPFVIFFPSPLSTPPSLPM
jgi:hypothetical protein